MRRKQAILATVAEATELGIDIDLDVIALALPNDETPRERKQRVRPPAPKGLRTAAEAAQRLGTSIKTLGSHIAAGELRYVIVGQGRKRPRRMFTDADLDEFISRQTHRDSPACRFPKTRVRPIGDSISKSEVIAFSVRPNARTSARPKR